MYSYDQPLRVTYSFPAAAISANALIGTFIGPVGKTGRVVHAGAAVTVATTGTASIIEVGIAANGVENLSMSVPATAVNLGHAVTAAELAAGADIIADATTYVGSNGGSSAGSGDITIVVDWY